MSEMLMKIVKEVAKENQCNCDLDNWEPERDTGHSHVCRIHKMSKARYQRVRYKFKKEEDDVEG